MKPRTVNHFVADSPRISPKVSFLEDNAKDDTKKIVARIEVKSDESGACILSSDSRAVTSPCRPRRTHSGRFISMQKTKIDILN
jgi:hypothetical protein